MHLLCLCVIICVSVAPQDKLTDLSPCCSLTWDYLADRLQQDPVLFDTCIWPSLSKQGWQLQESNSITSNPSPAAAARVVFVPPAAYHASTSRSATPAAEVSCTSAQQVMSMLHQAQQPVPGDCVQRLREVEADGRAAALLAAAAATGQTQSAAAPHRTCADPSGRLTGLPTTRRRLVSCAWNAVLQRCAIAVS